VTYYELNMSKFGMILRRFTSFQIAVSLMMVQLEVKRIAVCTLYINMYINLTGVGCF